VLRFWSYGDDSFRKWNIDQEPRPRRIYCRCVLDGWACHYNVEHTNYKTGLREIFLPGCFAGTLWGVLFLRDHILSEKAMANEDDGDLELLDSDAGLAIRVHLSEGVLERLEGRRELSVGYRTMNSKIRADGVRVRPETLGRIAEFSEHEAD
jgi:hypothetical protein